MTRTARRLRRTTSWSSRRAHARILWLLPITRAEKDFRHENGLEALESLFDDHAIDPVDPKQTSDI
jgi:Suppressor of fused protein (SUFU)